MTKYKININRPEVSSEEITERRNFNVVLTKYTRVKHPLLKTNWTLTNIVIVTILISTFASVVIIRDILNKKNDPAISSEPSEKGTIQLTEDKIIDIFKENGYITNDEKSLKKYSKGITVNAFFLDSKELNLSLDKVYLVDKNEKSIYIYSKEQFSHLKLNPASEYSIWGITRDKKLAAAYLNKNRSEITSQSDFAIVMKVYEKDYANSEELESWLSIK